MQKINIQVLGSGCPTCKMFYDRVLKVAQKIDAILAVEYITDIAKMVELGAMSSPVLAIDNKIISVGKMPDEEEIAEVISEKLGL